MTPEQFLVLQIRTSIAELPTADRATVDRHTETLGGLIAADPETWSLALALVGAELVALS